MDQLRGLRSSVQSKSIPPGLLEAAPSGDDGGRLGRASQAMPAVDPMGNSVGGLVDDEVVPRRRNWYEPQGQVLAPINIIDDLLNHPAAKLAKGVAKSAYGAWTAAPRLVDEASALVKDAMNYADRTLNPKVSPLTGEVYDYQPQSALLRNIQREGVPGTLGSLAVGAVQNAPLIGLVSELGKSNRDYEQVGNQFFNTATAGPSVWDYYRKLPVRFEIENGYTFAIDRLGRTVWVEGNPTVNRDQIRNRGAQLRAGGADRLDTDHGGHLIARILDGPLGDYNYIAQDSNLNQGAYAVWEKQLAKLVDEGAADYVRIAPQYRWSSLRPKALDASYIVDGDIWGTRFLNRPGGK